MIINDYVLQELNQQRRTQVADAIAAQRETQHGRRPRLRVVRRLTRTGARTRPVIDAVGARPLAH